MYFLIILNFYLCNANKMLFGALRMTGYSVTARGQIMERPIILSVVVFFGRTHCNYSAAGWGTHWTRAKSVHTRLMVSAICDRRATATTGTREKRNSGFPPLPWVFRSVFFFLNRQVNYLFGVRSLEIIPAENVPIHKPQPSSNRP